MKRLGPLVLFLCACQTETGEPADTVRQPLAATPASATTTAPPAAPSAPRTFAGLGADLLEWPAARLADDAVAGRFAVSEHDARRWALGWLAAHAELPGPAHVCLALPWLDAAERTVAYLFVLTDLPGCASYAGLVAEMRRIAAATNEVLGTIAPPDGRVWADRTRRSAEHFFTLAVSAWSFQHPLRDGTKGLPFWLIALDRLPAATPAERLEPTAVYPVANLAGLVEVVRYEGPAGPFLFSHHRGAPVARGSLGWHFDPGSVLRDWRTLVQARHAADPAGAVAAQAALWTRYLDGGAP
jgi:hypothetical protein